MHDRALRGWFVTGTDTGVGKTWAACALIVALRQGQWRVSGMKPVASGCRPTPEGLHNDDALALRAVSSAAMAYGLVNPYAFEPAIAPHIAAREAGVGVRFDAILAAARMLARENDCLVVEGVGGWRVPLGEDGDVAALAARLGLPVVLVVGLRLGCLNHALLSAQAIADAGLPLAGWVGSTLDPDMDRLEDNLTTLREGMAAPCLGILPHLAFLDAERLAAALDLSPLEC